MTTLLGASASLLIRAAARAAAYAAIAALILLMISIAATAQDVVSALPTGPAPVPEVPTVTLWRDGVIMVAIAILVVVVVWRASMLDLWVHSRMDLHGMAAALMHDEMERRGLAAKPEPAPQAEPTLEQIDDPWEVQADKLTKPAPQPAPRRVTPSTKQVAHTFSAPRRRGEKVQ